MLNFGLGCSTPLNINGNTLLKIKTVPIPKQQHAISRKSTFCITGMVLGGGEETVKIQNLNFH